ncbi:MAG: DUF523 domain-containing protein [Anaerotardibacter sp.]
MIIGVSACLLGKNCRYDGASKPNEAVIALKNDHTLIPFCPEVMAGLSIPHPANEIQTNLPSLKVVDSEGTDNTQAFCNGAQKALTHLQKHQVEAVILKAKSPSCGVGQIYDGTFSKTLVPGNGVAAQAIIDAGIPVTTEKDLSSFEQEL